MTKGNPKHYPVGTPNGWGEQVDDYVKKTDLYNKGIPLPYRWNEIVKYANQKGVKISDLSEDELSRFKL